MITPCQAVLTLPIRVLDANLVADVHWIIEWNHTRLRVSGCGGPCDFSNQHSRVSKRT